MDKYIEDDDGDRTTTSTPNGPIWNKDADGFYRCRGTATPASSTVTASVMNGEALIMGIPEPPPAGSHYQFRFTLPANTAVVLVVVSSSGWNMDIETVGTTTGP